MDCNQLSIFAPQRNAYTMKKRIDPKEIATKDLHQYLLGSVAPRPIAFVSTVDENGRHNLAPYSFFNAFSSNPPILVFSSNRRVADNTTKDTLHNIEVNKECVISVVNYNIMRQMALTSVTFPSEVSEFDKTGLTPVPSEMVNVPAVKESPVNMECTVKEIITLGEHGGAGHLIICDVKLIHVDENVIENNRINPHKIDLVGRMGRSYYVRASGDAVLTLYQNVVSTPIGYESLPAIAKKSEILTGNDLGELAALETIPDQAEIDAYHTKVEELGSKVEEYASSLIKHGQVMEALCLLMAAE